VKYFANKTLLVIYFFRHTTPFYNFKTQDSKPNKIVNETFLKFLSLFEKNSQDNKTANVVMSVS